MVIEDHNGAVKQMALFPSDRSHRSWTAKSFRSELDALDFIVQTVGRLLVGLPTVEFAGSRYTFWIPRLPPSRKNTHWLNIF